jgi:L-threonylcarbamoyladenylate synthase
MELIDGFNPLSVERAVTILKTGGLVAFPTETVYGLGADALNPYAVAKIFETKKRPRFDPLIVHLGEKEWVEQYVEYIPAIAEDLIDKFWPGPLTIIFQKQRIIPDIVTAGLKTIGLRMPSHPVALNLIRSFHGPIAAPSANPFGYMSPTKAFHVARMFKDREVTILDGGDSAYGIESTIVSIQNSTICVHRHGAICMEELSRIGHVIEQAEKKGICGAPGELPYHYAPHKPLKIIDSTHEIEVANSSFLAFKKPPHPANSKYMLWLSKSGDIGEAAANFFSYLIELDREDIDIIYAERIPEVGLGKAMMERLKKASKKYRSINIDKSKIL